MSTTIKFPKAVVNNQAADKIDFIEEGAWNNFIHIGNKSVPQFKKAHVRKFEESVNKINITKYFKN